MEFGIIKCATMVIRPNNPLFSNKRDPIFYLYGQPLPIPFDKSLELDPIVKYMNNKVNNSLYSVSNFLRNPKNLIPFKKIILNSILIRYLDLIKALKKSSIYN